MRAHRDEATIFRRAYSLITVHVMLDLWAMAFREEVPLVANIARGIGLLCAFFACYYYVRSKELPRRYIFLGLFGFVGFCILLWWSETPALDDVREESEREPV